METILASVEEILAGEELEFAEVSADDLLDYLPAMWAAYSGGSNNGGGVDC